MAPDIAEAQQRARKEAVRWAYLYVLNAYTNHDKARLVVDVCRARLTPHYAPEESERLLAEVQDEARRVVCCQTPKSRFFKEDAPDRRRHIGYTPPWQGTTRA